MYGLSFGTGSEGLGFAALPKWARNRSTRDDALHAGLAELREALPTRNDPEGATRIRNWVNSTLQSLQQPSLFG